MEGPLKVLLMSSLYVNKHDHHKQFLFLVSVPENLQQKTKIDNENCIQNRIKYIVHNNSEF
jgi:hypothetical protein